MASVFQTVFQLQCLRFLGRFKRFEIVVGSDEVLIQGKIGERLGGPERLVKCTESE